MWCLGAVSKTTKRSVCFQGRPFNITIIQAYSPVTLKKLKLNGSMKTPKPSRNNTPKGVLFNRGDWNTKVGSQEIPGIAGQFGLGVQNKSGQRLTEFC